ncbi:Ff.00g134190.m01.CDS01 [Fusarium sp. VM40]|nr:Ff.00g134190.m01.CDS01 [Fusarium sp. VM40]
MRALCPVAKRNKPSSRSSPSHEEQIPTASPPFLETEDDSNNLQPSGLLNHEALTGKFSLGNILNANREPVPPLGSRPDSIDVDDPVSLGLINPSLAISLFDSFITILNPYISQLDPHLHTFSHVRQKSAFLLSAVLSMSAKAFNHALYNKLYEHAQHLYVEVFRRGSKSVEIVQAILILTYWKEPQDTRVWTSVGYAIRICMDMGWNKLSPCSSQVSAAQSEMERRERRNIERTWFVLFVYDRSMSLQTGRPWMIECSDLIESIQSWCDEPLAIENDQLLGAFTTLRLITSTAFPFLVSRSQRRGISHLESEPLVSLINGRIDSWEEHWTRKVATAQVPACHDFLIRFYGTHLRLQLYTLPSHGIISSAKSDSTLHLDTIWIAYSSALSMLELISRNSVHICFAQDSIHIMTAYSAAFLVKVLLSVSGLLASRMASDTIEAIQNAARVFSDQSGCISSSCTLQATFLTKVGVKLAETQNKQNTDADNNPNEESMQASMMPDQDSVTEGSTTVAAVDPSLQWPFHSRGLEISSLPQGSLDFPFECNDMWAELFATVGTDAQDLFYLSQADC